MTPTKDNPITDEDRRLGKLLDLPSKSVWLARQPLPPLGELRYPDDWNDPRVTG